MRTAGLLLLVASGALSFCLTLVVRALARRHRFLDEPDGRKTHARAVPYGGGIAIVVATVLPLAAVAAVLLLLDGPARPAWFPESIHRDLAAHVSGAISKLPQLGALLAGGLVIFALGLLDDRRRLGPWIKLVVQIVVAVGVAAAGIRVTVFLHSEILGALLTVVWIVVITNAFNFMDNMDGLSAGVALIIGVIFVTVAAQSGQLFIALALVPFVGALAGFLPFNYAPATIFMGDAGSLFLG
ncbi:MAG TPA: MraY family glycosyltransferase, partial [Planctomycetota bacterium]|nr:MraY family glycosyltransferase [Planctomycetota bacterium]